MPPDELTGVHIQGLLLVVPQELIEPAPAARVLAAS